MLPPSSSTSRAKRDVVARAVDALLKWLRRHPGDDFLHLVLTTKKAPRGVRPNNFRVPLPHRLYSSCCLLVDDRPRSSLAPSAARDAVRHLALPLSDVLTLSEIRSRCRTPEARRSLAASHDLFLADRRLIPLLPSLLGDPFFSKKKKGNHRTPVPLDLSIPSWPEDLQQACGSTKFHLVPTTSSEIKVGRASQGRDDLIDNVMAAIEGVVLNVPKKWKNVRSLHLKATNSLALPLYDSMETCAKIECSSRPSNVEEKKQGSEAQSQVEEIVEIADEVESESDVDAQDKFKKLINYLRDPPPPSDSDSLPCSVELQISTASKVATVPAQTQNDEATIANI
ncbi:hypothetical protein ZIOFF_016953 [Zingiber officinale]|uniref:Ribosomal L1 domain-containing protein 1 n=1 Tax=Zingiber officinale TaxID=94328 RepID=A0A8J5H4D4_ZINOF|nr:hypothetical protein ZIOFF_016953 [Zingiber officinale]